MSQIKEKKLRDRRKTITEQAEANFNIKQAQIIPVRWDYAAGTIAFEGAADDSADDGTDERGAPRLCGHGFRLKPVYFALGFLVGHLLTLLLERLLMI